jgi:hypothetical protein
VKITSVVAGRVAGADSIDDLGVIRHGALPGIFGGIRAPSTLGTFLRGFSWGAVRQLDAVARETLIGLSRHALLLPGADSYAFLDVDSTINRVYGYAKQGADYGYTRVRGLHPLLATVSTPIAAPVIVGTRLRRGCAGSATGAASFVAEAITTARAAGATGILLARMDSAFDTYAVVSTCIRAGVHFSITTKQTRPVRAAIQAIPEHAWVPIAYPHAIYDETSGQWISDAHRRDHLHCISLAVKIRADHPPVDRPASERQKRRPRPGRVVHRLALPRVHHRLDPATRDRRETTPPTRDH